ncbi:MAG: hypothetical protein A2Y23_02895 [Clostridiales bacterium GWB2_37_7]|nr:MAG: hypothetical protein A2Y23_02895 [Clostridiales bacterium GWB2_37_7]
MDKNYITDILIDDNDEREQRIHELLRARKSLNVNTEMHKVSTLGERMSDRLAKFAGSWHFLIFFGIVVLTWGVVNTTWILTKPFDPYPYVFLNLILACIASLQAPIIMMSQNRESQKDRIRAENDYLINLKSEIILEDMHMKVDELLGDQKRLKKQLNDIMISMNGTNQIYDEKVSDLRSDKDGKANTGGEEPRIYNRDNRTH